MAAALAAGTIARSAESEASPTTVRLRIAWGGGAARQWEGTISVSEGTVRLISPLGMEPDEPGSMWNDERGVSIKQRSPRPYDGVDVEVAAPLGASLAVALADTSTEGSGWTSASFTLGEVIHKPSSEELDAQGNRVLVRRMPGDAMRVEVHHPHLVFRPGEILKFDVLPHHLPAPLGTTLQMKARLLSRGDELSVQEKSYKVAPAAESMPVAWEFELPKQEGVYDLAIEAIEPNSRPWAKPKLAGQRRLQVVVVSDRPGPSSLRANWTAVMEIDPTHSRWTDRFRTWSLFTTSTPAPLGHGGMRVWRHPLGPVVELEASNDSSDFSWQAYPLEVARPGMPHILEVEYPSDVPQTLGISIVEPNAAGSVLPIGLDSGVHVVEEPTSAPGKWLKHRLVFWPRTKSPLALLVNRGDGSPAVFGKLRLLAGPARLPRRFGQGDVPERLVMGYMSRPLVPENFGAIEAVDPLSRRSLDDWQTFLDAYRRLAEYLNYQGLAGQMIGVVADGSAIYPSEFLESTPKYDSGSLFDAAQDPVRKDALELMLRIFDRERLKLVPALQFVAPLPELEEKLRQPNSQSSGIALIGADGGVHPGDDSDEPGARPYYNPLHPEVQTAMLRVARELVERYRSHPALAGLALELSAESFTHLPGEAWPLDDHTIAAFEQATGLRVPGDGSQRFAERARFLTGPKREAWLKWRAVQLAQFYGRMQQELAAVRPDAVFYLAPTSLLDHPEARDQLRPSLPVQSQVDEVLLGMGFDTKLLLEKPGLCFLRPHRTILADAPAKQGVELEINRSTELDALLRGRPGQVAGCLCYHQPLPLRLESFDAKSPWGKEKTYTWLVSHVLPSEQQNRQRLAHALAGVDCDLIFDGGWMMPLGQEDALADFLAAYRRLPAGDYQTHSDAVRPVVVRWLATHHDTYAYLVNDSDWPTSVELALDLPPGCGVEELSGRRQLPAVVGEKLTLSLEPYELVALRFRSPAARIASVRLHTDEALQQALERQVHDLQQRVANLVSPPPLGALVNADFEQPPKGDHISGWSLAKTGAAEMKLDAEGTQVPPGKQAGKQCLRLSSNGALASLRSDVIAAPPTGRLSMSVYLRVEDPQQQPTLQLAIEYVHEGKRRYVSANVGAGPPQFAIPGEWKQFIFQVNDLPTTNVEQFRARFDLMGKGTVWIDDVQLFDLVFSGAERLQLSKMVALVQTQYQAKRYGECLDELNGYWPRFLSAYVPLPPAVAQQRAGAAGRAPPRPGNGPAQKPADKAAAKPALPWWRVPVWKR